MDRVAGLERAERARPRPDRLHQESELAVRGEAEAHRPGEHAPRGLEHEELTRDARLQRAAIEAEQRVRPDRIRAEDGQPLAPRRPAAKCQLGTRKGLRGRAHASIPMRSCRESADSARAFAIACTAAAAPEIVVMHGTRAMSAASRM